MRLFRATRLLGPLLSAFAFATYANPVFVLLLDGALRTTPIPHPVCTAPQP